MTAGYSGTPLGQKLELKPGASILPIGAPDSYPDWIGPLPDGATLADRGPADLAHLFVRTRAELEGALPGARAPSGRTARSR